MDKEANKIFQKKCQQMALDRETYILASSLGIDYHNKTIDEIKKEIDDAYNKPDEDHEIESYYREHGNINRPEARRRVEQMRQREYYYGMLH